KPPDSITDGVVVLRKLREDDRAVVLSTMRDPVVARWLNMPQAPCDRDFDSLLRLARNGRASGDRIDYTVTEAEHDISLGAGIAAQRAGFQREGLERNSIWLHSERQDAIVWSLLPTDPR